MTYNLSTAARVVGVSRQRIHQIAVKKGIGISRPSANGKRLSWEFSQEEVDEMCAVSEAYWRARSPHIPWSS